MFQTGFILSDSFIEMNTNIYILKILHKHNFQTLSV